MATKYTAEEKKALRGLIIAALVGSVVISLVYLFVPYIVSAARLLNDSGSSSVPFFTEVRLIAAAACFGISFALGVGLSYVMVNNTHKAMEEENEIG
jgi:hypothetical protein